MDFNLYLHSLPSPNTYFAIHGCKVFNGSIISSNNIGVYKLNWVISFLTELSYKPKEVPKVFCDNLNATYTCVNPVFHVRTKHLALNYFFVHEKVSSNELKVKHIPSKLQLVDALTKALPKEWFK